MKFGLSRNDQSALGARIRRSLSAMSGATLVFALMAGCSGGGGGTTGGGGGSTNGGGGGGTKAVFTGVVVDANNGDRPVEGVTVAVNGAVAITNSAGAFSVEANPVGANVKGTVQGPIVNGEETYYRNGYYCPPASGCSLMNLVDPGFPVPSTAAGEARSLGTFKLGSTDGPPFPPGF